MIAFKEMSKIEKTLWTAKFAKILCSGVFVSEREPNEIIHNSILGHDAFLNETTNIISNWDVDKRSKKVYIELDGGLPREAKYYGDQGSVTLPLDTKNIFFNPVKLQPTISKERSESWPLGDSKDQLSKKNDSEKIKEAEELAFDPPEALTTAFIVVHNGNIVAERYGLGIGKDTQCESWSMGKSVTATLIGVLIKKGILSLHEKAPISQWQKKNDLRSDIKISDLLRMSSGLEFTGMDDPPEKYIHILPDHEYIYSGSIDVFQFSINKPPEFLPNTVGRYRNCDPLSLGYIIKNKAYEIGEEYLSLPQKILFDRIGIRKQILETDPYGNFIMTGFDYGTPRNWARLGLLYLNDGEWFAERILPEGFVDFISTPAPAWKRPEYGGLFWINGNNRWNLSPSTFFMSGVGGQKVLIDKKNKLVIVRMGHRRGGRYADKSLNNAITKVKEALKIN
jgi:CubicO group peptidase (beta-lactamase class C family)